MMWKTLAFAVLLLAPMMAYGQDSFEDDALYVDLATGSYGADLQVGDLSLPKTFLKQIKLVNSGRYDMVLCISGNDIRWKLLTGLAQNEKVLGLDELKIEWETLHECADTALDLTRKSTVLVLLERMGLESPRVFVKIKPSDGVSRDTPYVKVYAIKAPWVEPVRANTTRIERLEHDYDIMNRLSVTKLVSPLALPAPFDTNLRFVIEGGEAPYKTRLLYDGKLVSTTTIDTVYTVDEVGEHEFEVMVVDAAGDTVVVKEGLVKGLRKTWALATMAGATTTRHMISPEISATLFYKDAVMLRANGFHGLGLTEERSIYGQPESTYDKGWGAGFGFSPHFLGPVWIYGGVHAQTNTLATSELAGDITGWFRGGELGLMLIADQFQVSATYLYGDVKEYDVFMTNYDDFRLSINLGNTWR